MLLTSILLLWKKIAPYLAENRDKFNRAGMVADSGRSRPGFRAEADRRSGVMATGIPF
jgi:hypothetical protein